MSYPPGTRVKKVRSLSNRNIGVTGIVVPNSMCQGPFCPPHSDAHIKIDGPWTNSWGKQLSGGQVACVIDAKRNWEPIVPEGHQPCETGYPEELEDLLEARSPENV